MADSVMLYSSLRRSAGGMAEVSLGPGSELGKGKKRGTAKKEKGERSESRGDQLASLTILFAFPPCFLGKSPGHEIESN